MEKQKIPSSVYSEAIITKIGSVKRQDKEAYMCVIRKSQEISIVDEYLTRYEVQKVRICIRSNRREVGVNYGIQN